QPRTDEIVATLRRRPPELILAGYKPFRALRAFLDEGYLPSRWALGLWVRRDGYRRFEQAEARSARSPSSARARLKEPAGWLLDDGLVTPSESGHDRVPALAEGVTARGVRHASPLVRPVNQRQQGSREPLGRFGRFYQDPRRPGLNGLADAPG